MKLHGAPLGQWLRQAWWVSLASLACVPAAVQPAETSADMPRAEREVVERSNAFRHAHGLAPTTPHSALTTAAKAFAAFMVRTAEYGHEADGHSPAERAQAQGYAYCMVAENLAYLQSTRMRFNADELAQRFVQGWIDSPGHRHNLLNAEAIDIGVAVAHDPRNGRYYAVQMFGRPAAMRTHFEISNRSEQTVRYRLGDERFSLPPRVTREHEQCSDLVLSLDLPGHTGPTTLQPANGANYRIEPGNSSLRLVRH